MLYALQKAIKNHYDSASCATLRSLCNGLWEDEAPPNVDFPYITFSDITSSWQQTFGTRIKYPLVQFTIWDNANNISSSRALLIENAFEDAFEDVLLSCDLPWTIFGSTTIEQRKLKDEHNVWQIIFDIEFWMEEEK